MINIQNEIALEEAWREGRRVRLAQMDKHAAFVAWNFLKWLKVKYRPDRNMTEIDPREWALSDEVRALVKLAESYET